MGVKFPGKNSYVTLEWPPEAIQVLCNAMWNGGVYTWIRAGQHYESAWFNGITYTPFTLPTGVEPV